MDMGISGMSGSNNFVVWKVWNRRKVMDGSMNGERQWWFISKIN